MQDPSPYLSSAANFWYTSQTVLLTSHGKILLPKFRSMAIRELVHKFGGGNGVGEDAITDLDEKFTFATIGK